MTSCLECEQPAKIRGLCNRHYCRRQYVNNRERHLAQTRAWALANPEKRRAIAAKYRLANIDKTRAAVRVSQKRHPETKRQWVAENVEKRRSIAQAWRERNPEYRRVNKAKRRRARPPWMKARELVPMQREARRRSLESGVVHHVDHIIPLIHPLICGLDVPWNLRVVPADENRRKGNRIDLEAALR